MDARAIADEKGLVKTPDVITTAEQFRGAVQRWQGSYNLLTPFTNISGLAAAHGIFSTVIPVNTNPASGEVYDGLPFLKNGQVALAKNGLRKIAEGLGISTRLEYLSVGAIRFYWHVKAIASYTGIDGKTVTREASMEWDLRDDSPRLKGWTPKQVEEGRKYGLRACETRAINAAIRECGCGLKQAYGKDELARPFVAVRVALTPDMADPDIKRIVTEHFVGATRQLYPAAAPSSPADPWGDDEPRPEGPKPVGQGATAEARKDAGVSTEGGATTGSQPKDDPPPTKNAVRIVDIKTYTGTNQKTGKAWTKFGVIDSQGEEHGTFSATLHDRAQQAKDAKEWVELTSEQNGQYTNLVEIAKAGESPELPGLGEL